MLHCHSAANLPRRYLLQPIRSSNVALNTPSSVEKALIDRSAPNLPIHGASISASSGHLVLNILYGILRGVAPHSTNLWSLEVLRRWTWRDINSNILHHKLRIRISQHLWQQGAAKKTMVTKLKKIEN